MILHTKVSKVLSHKGKSLIRAVQAKTFVSEAVSIMEAQNIGAVVVVENDEIVGLLSERECVRKMIGQGLSANATRVSSVMLQPVVLVNSDTTVQECFALMTEYRVRHLPVVDNARLVGLVSIGDVVKFVIDDHIFSLDQMTRYATGSYGPLESVGWANWLPEEVTLAGKQAA